MPSIFIRSGYHSAADASWTALSMLCTTRSLLKLIALLKA